MARPMNFALSCHLYAWSLAPLLCEDLMLLLGQWIMEDSRTMTVCASRLWHSISASMPKDWLACKGSPRPPPSSVAMPRSLEDWRQRLGSPLSGLSSDHRTLQALSSPSEILHQQPCQRQSNSMKGCGQHCRPFHRLLVVVPALVSQPVRVPPSWGLVMSRCLAEVPSRSTEKLPGHLELQVTVLAWVLAQVLGSKPWDHSCN